MFEFGSVLKGIRIKLGFSLEKVAYNTGITNSRMSKIERGKMSPSLDDLKKVAKLYNVNLIDVLIEAKYLSKQDMKIYKKCFEYTDFLDETEKKHIQNYINFLTNNRIKK